MDGLLTITGIIIIVFGILQIILFFKMWEMTNNIKQMKESIKDDSTFHKARLSFTKGDIDEAERLLNESYLEELTTLLPKADTPYRWEFGIMTIEKKYTAAFKKIDRPLPDFNKYRNPKMYLL